MGTVTIDFDSVTETGSFVNVDGNYLEDGFVLSPRNEPTNDAFTIWQSGSWGLLSPAVSIGWSPGDANLATASGSSFSIHTIDVDSLTTEAQSIAFVAHLVDGSSQQLTFNLDASRGMQTLDFGDLVVTSLDLPTNLWPYELFDNFVVTEGPTDGDDILYGDENDNVIDGLGGNDQIFGLGGDDALYGSGDNDVLNGGTGADTLDGGTGSDTASYADATSGVHANLGASYVNSGEAAGDQYASIENLRGSSFNDWLVGDSAANIIHGGDGNDQLEAIGSGDSLSGEGGNDALYSFANSNNAYMDGGEGTDRATVNRSNDSIAYNFSFSNDVTLNDGTHIVNVESLYFQGGSGNDEVTGGTASDTLLGGVGNDTLNGGDGNDDIRGEGGNDILSGGAGNDVFIGGAGDDVIDGGADSDFVVINLLAGQNFTFTGNQTVLTADGNDTYLNVEAARIVGSTGAETITGGSSADELRGGSGNDILNGAGGNDYLYGEAGNDILDGGTGSDYVDGGDNDDSLVLKLGEGSDTLVGGAGNDTLYFNAIGTSGSLLFNFSSGGFGGSTWSGIERLVYYGSDGADDVTGGAGNDEFQTYLGNDVVHAGAGNDSIHGNDGNDQLFGEAGNDSLVGEAGDDQLDGGVDNDFLMGGYGNDVVNGGAGEDQVYIQWDGGSDAVDGSAGVDMLVVDNLHSTSATTFNFNLGSFAGNVWQNMETLYYHGSNTASDNVTGSSGADTIFGNGGNDQLWGAQGNDALNGGDGDDVLILYRGYGADAFDGGAGTDTLWLINPSASGLTFDFASASFEGSTWQNIERLNFNGSAASESVIGGAIDDNLQGSGGDDVLDGAGGNDQLHGDAGNDTIRGGGGDDEIYLNPGDGADTIDGGDGNDRLSVNAYALGTGIVFDAASGAFDGSTFVSIERTFVQGSNLAGDSLSGQEGEDALYGFGGNDTISGRGGNDDLRGGDGNDALYGGSGNDLLNGDAGDDILSGNAGNDGLNGGTGNDLLIGDGGGDDTLNGGAGTDRAYLSFAAAAAGISYIHQENATVVTGDGTKTLISVETIQVEGSAFADSITGGALDDNLAGGVGDDVLYGLDGNDSLYGEVGNDTLYGAAGQDLLLGDAGDDTLNGGVGADYLDGGTGNDTVSYADATGAIYAHLGAGQGLSGDAAGDTYVSIENAIGSAFDDRLTGHSGVFNVLRGGAGNDILIAQGPGDSLFGEDGDDELQALVGTQGALLDGGTGIDFALIYRGFDTAGYTFTLTDDFTLGDGTRLINVDRINFVGGSGSDTITGGGLCDELTGGGGNDTLRGAGGDDSLSGSAGNDTLYGGAGNDLLNGDEGNDDLFGDTGNDVLDGGDGYDRTLVDFRGSTSAVTFEMSNNVTAVTPTGTQTFRNIEGADIYGTDYDDVLSANPVGAGTIFGGTGNDVLTGGDGSNNFLRGELGDDRLFGGAMRDFLDGGAANDEIHGGGGDDDGHGGDGNDLLYGDDGNDTLFGDAGDDRVFGGTGNDMLDGGAGSDTVDYSASTAGAAIDLLTGQASSELGNDTLIGIENAIGGSGNDTFSWGLSVGNSTFRGNGGSDTLVLYPVSAMGINAPGTDSVAPGNGTRDVGILTGGVAATADEVERIQVQGSSTGYDVSISGDYSLTSLTTVTLVGWSGIDVFNAQGLTSALRIEFFGNDGNDVVYGAASGANDLFDGGAGQDVVDYSSATSTVTINLAAGTAAGSQIGADTLVSIERAMGGSGNDSLTGDGTANDLNGGLGADALNGGGGNDTLTGGAGADTIDGGAGSDTVFYWTSASGVSVNLSNGKGLNGDAAGDTLSNIENVVGSIFNDVLVGNGGTNSIDGQAGNDTLNGGGGADFLTGGAGNDTFAFKSVADIGIGASTDVIVDFNAGGTGSGTSVDLIDLSAIDANTKTNKDDAFTFLGTGAFTGKAGELRYDGAGHLLGDANGDGIADFSLRIILTGTLDGGDFIF